MQNISRFLLVRKLVILHWASLRFYQVLLFFGLINLLHWANLRFYQAVPSAQLILPEE